VINSSRSNIKNNLVLKTGGHGLGTGYFADPRVAIENNGSCLFVSDAGSNDIAAFAATSENPLAFNPTPTRYPSGGDGSDYGIGLAITPNGKTLFATLDELEEVAIFTIGPGCILHPTIPIPVNDVVGPIAVSSDGKVLIVPGPNNSFVDAFAINSTGGLTLINTVSLNSVSSCSVVGCFPTGTDISNVSGGNATVVLGNGTVSGPYYITCSLNTTVGLSNCVNNNLTGTSLANIENPWFSSAGATGNGFIYFGASGDGSGYPAGVAVNQVTAGVINPASITSYVNIAGEFCSNVQSTGHAATQGAEFLWQSCSGSNEDNTTYEYSVSTAGGGSITLFKSYPNPQAQGNTFVLSLIAYPKR
jgi:hypothetical protein